MQNTYKKHQNTKKNIKQPIKPMYLSAKKQRKGEDRRRRSSGFDHQRLGGMCPYALAQLRIARHERNANEIEIDGPVRGTARAFSPPNLRYIYIVFFNICIYIYIYIG